MAYAGIHSERETSGRAGFIGDVRSTGAILTSFFVGKVIDRLDHCVVETL